MVSLERCRVVLPQDCLPTGNNGLQKQKRSRKNDTFFEENPTFHSHIDAVILVEHSLIDRRYNFRLFKGILRSFMIYIQVFLVSTVI